MINNTNEDRNRNVVFEESVANLVRNRITHSAVSSEYCDLTVGTGVTGLVKYASSALLDMLTATGLNVPVTDSSVEEALRTIVQLRCLQLSRALPRGIYAGDVPIPDFFRPFITALGKYDDPNRGLTICPVWSPDSSLDISDGKAEGNEAVSDDQYSKLVRTVRVLKANGVKVTNGLPRSLETTDDGIFRVQETASGELLVAGIDVSEVTLLVRGILRLQFLSNIFGAARTRYLSVEDLRPAIEAIVTTGFNQ